MLSHDHSELNLRVLDLATALAALGDEGALTGTAVLEKRLGRLRDLLFLHFAREEEALFPFVTERVPALESRVREMETSHDSICGALARMYELARVDGALSLVMVLQRRFESAYAEHSRVEAEVLGRLAQRLAADDRARLAALVAGI